jgi:hypothetical protein
MGSNIGVVLFASEKEKITILQRDGEINTLFGPKYRPLICFYSKKEDAPPNC